MLGGMAPINNIRQVTTPTPKIDKILISNHLYFLTKLTMYINGIDKSYTEWAKEYGLNESTIRMRIKYGWSRKDLLNPVNKKG